MALFDADPLAAGNPYPDARLVGGDGTIDIPDRYALRGLADVEDLGAARALLRAAADEAGATTGFSTTAPLRIALSSPVDVTTVGPGPCSYSSADGGLDVEGLLGAARRLGVRPSDVALAISFPTQPIADDLLAIRARFEELADDEFRVVLDDPDPEDDLAIGVFGPDQGPYVDFLAANPSVAFVVAASFRRASFATPTACSTRRSSRATSRPMRCRSTSS